MIRLALIRHAPTEWNRLGRLQGRRDMPLSDEGRQMVQQWHLPREMQGWPIWSSPLHRARQTAAHLSGDRYQCDARLIEMDWGAWEGQTLADLRAADPEAMQMVEARGRFLCPPGGESPQQVIDRVVPFCRALSADKQDAVLVTHKGVIRGLIAHATGWDMVTPMKIRVIPGTYHLLSVDDDGKIVVVSQGNQLVQGCNNHTLASGN